MKRLMYMITLSAMAVLVFAAIAVAQSVPEGQEEGQEPSQNPAADAHTTDVQNRTTVPAEKKPAETTTPAESTAPATDLTMAVDIRDHAFNPDQLDVPPGKTVMFVNNDTEPHTATADNELFDTGELAPGESSWVYFEGAGTVTYHCELHPDMQGTIVIGQAGQAGGAEGTDRPNLSGSVSP